VRRLALPAQAPPLEQEEQPHAQASPVQKLPVPAVLGWPQQAAQQQ